jgi:hypothetical protein
LARAWIELSHAHGLVPTFGGDRTAAHSWQWRRSNARWRSIPVMLRRTLPLPCGSARPVNSFALSQPSTPPSTSARALPKS